MSELESISKDDAKSLFMNEVSNELQGIFEPEVTEDASVPSEETQEEEVAAVEPTDESEEVAEEDSEEDILNELLGDEDDEGESDDAEEEVEAITNDSPIKLKVDGEEIEVTLDELKKGYGRNKSLTQKEMAVADRSKELDDRENTITHLQYQGEFAPQFYELNKQQKTLEEAKEALAAGKPFGNVSGDQLVKEITAAEVIVKRNEEKLQKEYTEKTKGVDAPGRKALESRLPDIAEKFPEYSNEWAKVGKEFGFTDVELANNSDFRWYNLAQEVIEQRAWRKAQEEKLEKIRAKRRGGAKVATASSPKKSSSKSSKKSTSEKTGADYDSLNDRINSGDIHARAELMQDLFGN